MGLQFGGHTTSTRGSAASKRGNDAIQGSDTPATRRQRASHGAKPPTASTLKCTASPTRPGRSTGWRDNAATLKPTTPLLTPNKEPLKPASPLPPKNAPKTPVSHTQRRWRFQTHANTHEQRRHGFQTTEPPGRQGLAEGPGWGSRRSAEGIGGPGYGTRGRRRGLAGLRDDAPSRTSATRHHWCGGHRRFRRAWLRHPWAVAGPGQASRRRATHQRPGTTGVEGAGGTGGHGRASRRGAERSEVA